LKNKNKKEREKIAKVIEKGDVGEDESFCVGSNSFGPSREALQ
jgi:hypothetical protein